MTRAALAQELANLPITLAYVFGSEARGEAGPLSDVDVAILPADSVPEEERLPLVARVSLIAADVYGRDRSDVILLDEAPPDLAFEAIRGELVVEEDAALRERVEARVLSAYHDRRGKDTYWERETRARYARGEFA